MRWKRTVLVWLGLVALFSVYNVPANVLGPPRTGPTFQDPKVLTYDFSLSAPYTASGNLTVPFNLERTPDFYVFHAYVFFSDELFSQTALGSYRWDWEFVTNGARVLSGSGGNVWFHYPYGINLEGTLPDRPCCTLIRNFTARTGSNVAVFQFNVVSNLTQHGEGSYRLSLGPFVVEVRDRLEAISSALALEAVAAAVLFPVSHLISQTFYKRKAHSAAGD